MRGRLLTEPEGYELLRTYGIQVPAYGIARSVAEASALAEDIGFPVVMKVISPQVIHKSDVGGVVRGVMNGEQVHRAYQEIMENVHRTVPHAEITGVIVEKEVDRGLELLIGGKVDTAFGRVISFGIGGTYVELLSDIALRVLPLTRDDIQRMIREIRGYRLIGGYRGESPKDEPALIAVIEQVIRLFSDYRYIREFDLNPLILYDQGACVVDARFIVDDTSPLPDTLVVPDITPSLIHPRSIAVVGASSDPQKLGYVIFRNLLTFPGQLFPVNPNHREILGKAAYPSLTAIPSPVDLVIIAVPAGTVPAIIEEAGRKSIPLAIIIAAGFKESGEEGKRREEELVRRAREGGVRILGPNCLGIMLPHQQINATFDPLSPLPGHIGFVSQSGAVVATVVDWSIPEGVGFSAIISIGNQADLGFDEFLKYLEQDEATRAIILYIEEIVNGREFIDVVGRVSEKKPVVVIKSGSSQRGTLAASSHTGSLAGSYNVYMAAFRQAGVMVTRSLREAFHVAELLASEGYPRGTRTVVITSAGGFAVLSSDYAEAHGVEMVELPPVMVSELNEFLPGPWSHQNPLDLVGDAGADRFARVFDAMIRHEDQWDIAVVVAVPSAVLDPTQLAQEIVQFSTHTHNMIVGCLLGGDSMKSGIRLLREHGIPNFSELEDAFIAMGRACSYRDKCIHH